MWSDYSNAFSAGHLGEYLRNSAIQSICITVAVLLTSVLAAYAFTFVRFPFKRALFAACLASLMVPAEVTILPNYQTIAAFGWLNTFPALIVPFMASGIGISSSASRSEDCRASCVTPHGSMGSDMCPSSPASSSPSALR